MSNKQRQRRTKIEKDNRTSSERMQRKRATEAALARSYAEDHGYIGKHLAEAGVELGPDTDGRHLVHKPGGPDVEADVSQSEQDISAQDGSGEQQPDEADSAKDETASEEEVILEFGKKLQEALAASEEVIEVNSMTVSDDEAQRLARQVPGVLFCWPLQNLRMMALEIAGEIWIYRSSVAKNPEDAEYKLVD